ncbi:HTH-type transcriptional repressor KstR2 [Paraconexibacter sp. AEG42_29]|uniref:HTH-type transcriptional repressor KstR2 n=1 Tax=Paraconexibacter sp. AEG42_29 TaxID=2997339 RepID=A0AAU7B388_9ACTN
MAKAPTSPALRERYDRRQAQVVDDAARVFADRGYDQTSVQDLSDAIGLAAGGIYHYFGGKEQLLISICDRLMDPLLDEARALTATPGDAATQLRAVVRLWVAHALEHRDHMLVFQQERHVIEHGDQWRAVRSNRKAFERLVQDLLARAHAERAPGGDRRLLLAALLGMVNHSVQWYRPGGRLKPEQIADGYLDLILPPGSA